MKKYGIIAVAFFVSVGNTCAMDQKPFLKGCSAVQLDISKSEFSKRANILKKDIMQVAALKAERSVLVSAFKKHGKVARRRCSIWGDDGEEHERLKVFMDRFYLKSDSDMMSAEQTHDFFVMREEVDLEYAVVKAHIATMREMMKPRKRLVKKKVIHVHRS